MRRYLIRANPVRAAGAAGTTTFRIVIAAILLNHLRRPCGGRWRSLAGLVMLGQSPAPVQWLAIVCIVAASAGTASGLRR